MIRFSIFSVLDFYADGSRSLSDLYTNVLDQISYADQLGFDAYWIGEHHGYLAPHFTLACPNPATLLAAAAQRTRHIGLNTAVANLSLRHPLHLAEDYALVDVLSQGRLGLGIGRGSYAHEYAAFGQSTQEGRGRFEESWEIFRRAWRGETVTFHGSYYHVDQARINVQPVQNPLPQYWYAAMKKESIAMLGRAAEPVICLPHLTADSLAALAACVQDYRRHYLAAGGEDARYEVPLFLFTCVAPTREEARQNAVTALRRYLVHQHHSDEEHLQYIMRQLEERRQLWFGTPADLIQFIEEYQAEMDARHFVFWLDFGGMKSEITCQSMQLLAQEVIPHIKAEMAGTERMYS